MAGKIELQKICMVCGKPFIGKNVSAKLCSVECKKIRARQCEIARKSLEKEGGKKAPIPKLKFKKPKSLAQVNREAREKGMTYGQYVAWLHCQKEREERERWGLR